MKHVQYDGRWLAVWLGVNLQHWGLGFIAKQDYERSLAVFIGPFYAGVGGYDR